MKRREFIRTLSRVTLVSACLGAGQSISCGKRKHLLATPDTPNIILFVADDLGWKDLGCYGDKQIGTPNIDKLAGEGIRFTNAFVVASSCSPSRAGIITGQYPHTNGVTGLTHVRKRLMLSPLRSTLAEILAERGYYTAIEGKWHVAPYLPTRWYGYQERLSGMLPKDFLIRSPEKALKFIEENRDHAFYLELNYMDTHRDDRGDFHFAEGFPVDPEKIEIPEYYALPDWPEIRADVAKYFSNTSKMDMMIGSVMGKLGELGLTERTLVCFVSDNGPPFPGTKMTLYDRGIGTPLIMRWPGKINGGMVNDSLISTIDIMPTLLDAAGCHIPQSVQGKSALPLIKGEGRGVPNEFIFAEMTYHVNYLPMRAVRSKKWKYIRNYSDDPIGLDQLADTEWAPRLCELPNQGWLRRRVRDELYDLENDPNEQENLAYNPAYREQMESMSALLDRHMQQTDDPFSGREFEKNCPA